MTISNKEIVEAFKKGYTDHENGLERKPPYNNDMQNFVYENGWCKFGLISPIGNLSEIQILEISKDPSMCGK